MHKLHFYTKKCKGGLLNRKFRLRRPQKWVRTTHFASQNIPEHARVYGHSVKKTITDQTPKLLLQLHLRGQVYYRNFYSGQKIRVSRRSKSQILKLAEKTSLTILTFWYGYQRKITDFPSLAPLTILPYTYGIFYRYSQLEAVAS
jgi:hypothetical protein